MLSSSYQPPLWPVHAPGDCRTQSRGRSLILTSDGHSEYSRIRLRPSTPATVTRRTLQNREFIPIQVLCQKSGRVPLSGFVKELWACAPSRRCANNPGVCPFQALCQKSGCAPSRLCAKNLGVCPFQALCQNSGRVPHPGVVPTIRACAPSRLCAKNSGRVSHPGFVPKIWPCAPSRLRP